MTQPSMPEKKTRPATIAFTGLTGFEERLAIRKQEKQNFSHLQKIYIKKIISEVFNTASLKF